MKTALKKRTIVIRGRKTSVSLEDDFWNGLRELATRKNLTISALATMISRDRGQTNLSSAMRIYVFRDFCTQLNNNIGRLD